MKSSCERMCTHAIWFLLLMSAFAYNFSGGQMFRPPLGHRSKANSILSAKNQQQQLAAILLPTGQKGRDAMSRQGRSNTSTTIVLLNDSPQMQEKSRPIFDPCIGDPIRCVCSKLSVYRVINKNPKLDALCMEYKNAQKRLQMALLPYE